MMLILMLIMMLKFCVKDSSNLTGLENFGFARYFIVARFGYCSPYQSESEQISSEIHPLPPPLSPPDFYIHQVFTLLLLEVGH